MKQHAGHGIAGCAVNGRRRYPAAGLRWLRGIRRGGTALLASVCGHRGGAFTGGANEHEQASWSRRTVVHLLLDEVRRLMYEGREKLFSILDKGEITVRWRERPAAIEFRYA